MKVKQKLDKDVKDSLLEKGILLTIEELYNVKTEDIWAFSHLKEKVKRMPFILTYRTILTSWPNNLGISIRNKTHPQHSHCGLYLFQYTYLAIIKAVD